MEETLRRLNCPFCFISFDIKLDDFVGRDICQCPCCLRAFGFRERKDPKPYVESADPYERLDDVYGWLD